MFGINNNPKFKANSDESNPDSDVYAVPGIVDQGWIKRKSRSHIKKGESQGL
jgi:hypothetical protein